MKLKLSIILLLFSTLAIGQESALEKTKKPVKKELFSLEFAAFPLYLIPNSENPNRFANQNLPLQVYYRKNHYFSYGLGYTIGFQNENTSQLIPWHQRSDNVFINKNSHLYYQINGGFSIHAINVSFVELNLNFGLGIGKFKFLAQQVSEWVHTEVGWLTGYTWTVTDSAITNLTPSIQNFTAINYGMTLKGKIQDNFGIGVELQFSHISSTPEHMPYTYRYGPGASPNNSEPHPRTISKNNFSLTLGAYYRLRIKGIKKEKSKV